MVSSVMTTVGGTITNGIQDISAILPLLGTDQCEQHVASALDDDKGFLYVAATPLSLFGSLGVVRGGLKALLASLTIQKVNFIGAKKLEDAGFGPDPEASAKGNVLSMMTLVKGGQFAAEARLTEMLNELHVDESDVKKLSVHWDCWWWNIQMVCLSVVFALLAIVPYVYIIRYDITVHEAGTTFLTTWAFPMMRILGGYMTGILVQFSIQFRVLNIVRRRLVLMQCKDDIEQISPEFNFKVSSDECWWKLDSLIELRSKSRWKGFLKFIGIPQYVLSSPPQHVSPEDLAETGSSSRRTSKTQEQEKSKDATESVHPIDVVPSVVPEERGSIDADKPTNTTVEERIKKTMQSHFPLGETFSRFLCLYVCQAGVLIGLGLSLVGYIGCFNLVQRSSLTSGTLSWLGGEIGLCIIRILIWAFNPKFDDNTKISFRLKLNRLPPLVTCSRTSEMLDQEKKLPVQRAEDFLRDVTSYTGPITQFIQRQARIYYATTRSEYYLPYNRVLYVTVLDYTENIPWALKMHENNDTFELYGASLDIDPNDDSITVALKDPIDPENNHMSRDKLFIQRLKDHCRDIMNRLKDAKQESTTITSWTLHTVTEPDGDIDDGIRKLDWIKHILKVPNSLCSALRVTPRFLSAKPRQLPTLPQAVGDIVTTAPLITPDPVITSPPTPTQVPTADDLYLLHGKFEWLRKGYGTIRAEQITEQFGLISQLVDRSASSVSSIISKCEQDIWDLMLASVAEAIEVLWVEEARIFEIIIIHLQQKLIPKLKDMLTDYDDISARTARDIRKNATSRLQAEKDAIFKRLQEATDGNRQTAARDGAANVQRDKTSSAQEPIHPEKWQDIQGAVTALSELQSLDSEEFKYLCASIREMVADTPWEETGHTRATMAFRKPTLAEQWKFVGAAEEMVFLGKATSPSQGPTSNLPFSDISERFSRLFSKLARAMDDLFSSSKTAVVQSQEKAAISTPFDDLFHFKVMKGRCLMRRRLILEILNGEQDVFERRLQAVVHHLMNTVEELPKQDQYLLAQNQFDDGVRMWVNESGYQVRATNCSDSLWCPYETLSPMQAFSGVALRNRQSIPVWLGSPFGLTDWNGEICDLVMETLTLRQFPTTIIAKNRITFGTKNLGLLEDVVKNNQYILSVIAEPDEAFKEPDTVDVDSHTLDGGNDTPNNSNPLDSHEAPPVIPSPGTGPADQNFPTEIQHLSAATDAVIPPANATAPTDSASPPDDNHHESVHSESGHSSTAPEKTKEQIAAEKKEFLEIVSRLEVAAQVNRDRTLGTSFRQTCFFFQSLSPSKLSLRVGYSNDKTPISCGGYFSTPDKEALLLSVTLEQDSSETDLNDKLVLQVNDKNIKIPTPISTRNSIQFLIPIPNDDLRPVSEGRRNHLTLNKQAGEIIVMSDIRLLYCSDGDDAWDIWEECMPPLIVSSEPSPDEKVLLYLDGLATERSSVEIPVEESVAEPDVGLNKSEETNADTT